MTEIQKRILTYLANMQAYADEGRLTYNDECQLGIYKTIIRDLEEELGTVVSLARARVEVHELRDAGLIELVNAVDYEYYAPNGSGWTLTKKGIAYCEEHKLHDEL